MEINVNNGGFVPPSNNPQLPPTQKVAQGNTQPVEAQQQGKQIPRQIDRQEENQDDGSEKGGGGGKFAGAGGKDQQRHTSMVDQSDVSDLKFEYDNDIGKIVARFTDPATGKVETHVFSDNIQQSLADYAGKLSLNPQDTGASNVRLPTPGASTEPTDIPNNPWFNNTYAVTLATSMLEMVKANKYQRIVDGNNAVTMMKLQIEVSVAIGTSIMESAKIEASIYRMEALMAGVSLGIALAGTAVSIAGLGITAAGTAKMKSADAAGATSVGTNTGANAATNAAAFTQGLRQQAQGEQVKMMGDAIGRTGEGATRIAELVIKAGLTIEKAKWDQRKALLEGQSKVLDNVLNGIQKDADDSKNAIDQTLETLKRIQSANAQAYRYTRG